MEETKTVKMTKGEMMEFWRVSERILSGGSDLPFKFAYALSRSRQRMKNEVVAINEALVALKEYGEYETKRVNLAKEHARKDDKGNPESVDGSFVLADVMAFNVAFAKMRKEYEEILTAHETLMSEEIELALYGVKIENMPEKINGRTLETLMPIIIDESVEEEAEKPKAKKPTPPTKPAAAASVSPKKIAKAS